MRGLSATHSEDKDGTPDELKALRQWVAWDFEKRDGKTTKVLYQAGAAGRARVNDSATWSTFTVASEASSDTRRDGIGFVFSSEDPYTGVDLDGCRDPETGEVEASAQEIVDDLDGYTEISPSGRGLHVIVRGTLPVAGKRRGKIEAYSSGRFFTMTGEGMKREIPERQEQLDSFYRKHLEAPADAATGAVSGSPELSDEEVIEKLCSEVSGENWRRLIDGDTEDYEGDASRADLALISKLYFYTQNFDQVDRIFRRSGLYREKWERADYRHRTFMKAANSAAGAWQPVRTGSVVNISGGFATQAAEKTSPAPDTGEPGSTESPTIRVNNRHLREVSADTIAALQLANDPPEVFVRSGALVRVREDENGAPEIQNMGIYELKGRADRVADFVRITKQGEEWIETKVNPPEVVIKDILALPAWPEFPALEAVVEAPILRPDGSIQDTPGYDPQTRLYYRPVPGFSCPPISSEPGRDDTRKALGLLNEALGDFRFADKASAANTLALLITAVIRPAIEGHTQLALIDAPQAGTGKSLLAEIVARIGTGRAAEMAGAPRTDEEWGKQITATLISGGTMLIFDNVESSLFAPNLARAITSETWKDRVLGRSEMATVKQRATWVATGNNISLRGDLPRRCYWIRLDAKESRPWQREEFKHSDLRAWVSQNRGELVGAILTLARAWYAAGQPKAENIPKAGSFEQWAEIVGSILQFAGVDGFLGNLEELYEKADEGSEEWEAFLEAWRRHKSDDKVTVKDLAKLIDNEKTLQDALPADLSEARDKGEGSFTRRLGKAISKRSGTRFGDAELHIASAGDRQRSKLWRVLDNTEQCEFVSFMSLYNPSASKNTKNSMFVESNSRSGEPDINSRNSQTHTKPEDEAVNPTDLGNDLPASFDLKPDGSGGNRYDQLVEERINSDEWEGESL